MKKIGVILVGTILTSLLLTGCFEADNNTTNTNNNNNNDVEIEPIGFWNNTTTFQWITNGTCCGEKEQHLQVYILGDEYTNETRWVDTNRTRDNASMLPDDAWYPTGDGNIYVREEEYRKHICLNGECIYSVVDVRWYQTGAIIFQGINKSKEISISRGETTVWYVVVAPVDNETVDIVFKLLGSSKDLPVFNSRDMRTEYHSGAVKLPKEYTLNLHLYSGTVDVYILDKIGYEQLFR